MVRRSELRNIKSEIELAFQNPAAAASHWATAWLGFGGGAFVATLALLAVQGDDLRPALLTALIGATVIGFFLAAFCWWFGRKGTENQGNLKDHACDQLEELDQRAPTVVPEEVWRPHP